MTNEKHYNVYEFNKVTGQARNFLSCVSLLYGSTVQKLPFRVLIPDIKEEHKFESSELSSVSYEKCFT